VTDVFFAVARIVVGNGDPGHVGELMLKQGLYELDVLQLQVGVEVMRCDVDVDE
jgi:hypothetical protein